MTSFFTTSRPPDGSCLHYGLRDGCSRFCKPYFLVGTHRSGLQNYGISGYWPTCRLRSSTSIQCRPWWIWSLPASPVSFLVRNYWRLAIWLFHIICVVEPCFDAKPAVGLMGTSD